MRNRQRKVVIWIQILIVVLVGALGKEALSIETDVDALIRDMNRAIAEADQFVAHL